MSGGSNKASLMQQWKPSGRSMFGKQADSKKQTFASHAFGQDTRNKSQKRFVSTRHSAVENRCTTSPGAIYSYNSAFKEQTLARKLTEPSFTFKSELRMKDRPNTVPGPGNYPTHSSFGDQMAAKNESAPRILFSRENKHQDKLFISSGHLRANYLKDSLQVGVHATQSSFGKQSLSTKRNSTPVWFPRTKRMKNHAEEIAKTIPGAGHYPTWESLGKQVKSQFQTTPQVAFGRGTRQTEDRRFITSGHTRILQGTYSPNNFDHQKENVLTGIGQQTLSTKKNSPNNRFSRTAKMIQRYNQNPGPGTYEN